MHLPTPAGSPAIALSFRHFETSLSIGQKPPYPYGVIPRFAGSWIPEGAFVSRTTQAFIVGWSRSPRWTRASSSWPPCTLPTCLVRSASHRRAEWDRASSLLVLPRAPLCCAGKGSRASCGSTVLGMYLRTGHHVIQIGSQSCLPALLVARLRATRGGRRRVVPLGVGCKS